MHCQFGAHKGRAAFFIRCHWDLPFRMSCFAVGSDSRWGTNFSAIRRGRTAYDNLRSSSSLHTQELSKLLRYVALINKCFEQACHHTCDGPLLSSRWWHHRWSHIASRHHLGTNSLAALPQSTSDTSGSFRIFSTCSFTMYYVKWHTVFLSPAWLQGSIALRMLWLYNNHLKIHRIEGLE